MNRRTWLAEETLRQYYGDGGPDAPVFALTFSGGDKLYVRPLERLKNGNWKVRQSMWYGDKRNPMKGVLKTINPVDFALYKMVDDVPPKVLQALE